MFKTRHDNYAIYNGIECRFWLISNGIYRLQLEKNNEIIPNGFLNYNEPDLKKMVYKDVKKVEISSAYKVVTYCNYNNQVYYIYQISDNKNEYNIVPTFETINELNLGHIRHDIVLKKKKDEIHEVWEERMPINGFSFEISLKEYLLRQ